MRPTIRYTPSPPCPTPQQGEVQLRPWRMEEASSLVALLQASMDSVGPWLEWCKPAYGIDDAQQWLRKVAASWSGHGDECALAIAIDHGRQPVGCIVVNQFHPDCRMANLGYWLATPYQNRGLMTHAVRLFADYVFAPFALQRLEIVVAVGNGPSRRVAEKSGARFEGLARQRLLIHGKPHDAAMYSLLPGDLLQSAAAHQAAISS